ncbi:MAG: cohesin domain-containing protein [archaeon]|nr:cohesin domain-containing protein [archaeon]
MKIKELSFLVIMVAIGMLFVVIVCAAIRPALATHDINVSTDYSGAVNGIKITRDSTDVVGADENLIIGAPYKIRYKIVNGRDYNESVSITVKVANTTWNETVDTHTWSAKIGENKTYSDEWNTARLSPGNYNITVNASIPIDDEWSNNERTREITLVLPSVSIASVSAPSDGSVTVPVMVNNVVDLGSGTINITYNSSVVHVTEVTSGIGNALTVKAWNIDNSTGIVQIVAWNASEPRSGNVIFANLTFKAVGSELSSSPLNISVRDLLKYDCVTPIPHTVSNGTFTVADVTPPIPTNIEANTTEAGMPVLFSAYWTDTGGLANYTFAWNDSRVWVNDSIVEMTGTGNWSNVTKRLNSTLKTIGWRIYCNDTSGNRNDTGIRVLTINDTIKPVLTDVFANPGTILNDNGRARPPGTNVPRLNVTVTDTGSGISNVTVNLSSIGGSSVQPMERIEGTDRWTVSTKATLGFNLTNELVIRAIDKANNSNTSSIYLTVLLRGDVVRDGNITSGDAFYIAKYLVGKESMPPMLVSDVVPATGDNKITSGDALYIAKYLVKKEPEP